MKRISNGVKMLISGLVAGFLLCFGLWALVLTTSAAELEPLGSSAAEVSESTSTEETPESEFVQDEQTEAADTEPTAPELPPEAVQDAQSETETGQSIDQSEPEPPPAEPYTVKVGFDASDITSYIEENTGEESTGAESYEFYAFAAVAIGMVIGSVFGLAFMTNWEVRT